MVVVEILAKAAVDVVAQEVAEILAAEIVKVAAAAEVVSAAAENSMTVVVIDRGRIKKNLAAQLPHLRASHMNNNFKTFCSCVPTQFLNLFSLC